MILLNLTDKLLFFTLYCLTCSMVFILFPSIVL